MAEWNMENAAESGSFAASLDGSMNIPESVGSAAPGIDNNTDNAGNTGNPPSWGPDKNDGSSGGNSDSGGSGSHSSSGGANSGSGSMFIELTDEDEVTPTAPQVPESEIVEITILDNFVDPTETASVTTAALSGGKPDGSMGLWAAPAALLAAALAVGILLRRRGRKNSRT